MDNGCEMLIKQGKLYTEVNQGDALSHYLDCQVPRIASRCYVHVTYSLSVD